MIVCSIDLSKGQTVQLIGGKDKALDAAKNEGNNRALIKELLAIAPCRVGGGIRDVQSAIDWLDAGAKKVILGTAAERQVLSKLPKERVIAAVDAYHGEVVVEGWQKGTGRKLIDKIKELEGLVGGFLVTFVEREGRLQGIDIEMVKKLLTVTQGAKLTVAGGISTAREIAELDRLGVDSQVGMAIYTKKLGLAEAIAAPLHSDRADGLWPTVVVDQHQIALGLAYSSLDSLDKAIELNRGVYQSRKRGIWVKGETSGAIQELLKIDLDCDRDALRFTVAQHGSGFCHQNTRTCWGDDFGLSALARRLESRIENAPPGSYTKRLFDDPKLLEAKIKEEAEELCQAQTDADIVHESADLVYFTLVKLIKAGLSIADVEAELDKRALKVTRRPGG
jgi:phosphoribosyl-ATP pyrophosphohydrolase